MGPSTYITRAVKIRPLPLGFVYLSYDCISNDSVHSVIKVASETVWRFVVVPVLNSDIGDEGIVNPIPPFICISYLIVKSNYSLRNFTCRKTLGINSVFFITWTCFHEVDVRQIHVPTFHVARLVIGHHLTHQAPVDNSCFQTSLLSVRIRILLDVTDYQYRR